jgi:penicillin amidase
VVDVSAPGLHFAGAGEPALPGITFGHNDTTAWGITIFYADQEDLYLYKTDKAHPGAYFHGGKWVPFEVVHEALPVKGEGDRTVELKYTLHGPVIWQDEAKGVALALRSCGRGPALRPISTRPGCSRPPAGTISSARISIGAPRRSIWSMPM